MSIYKQNTHLVDGFLQLLFLLREKLFLFLELDALFLIPRCLPQDGLRLFLNGL